MTLNYLVHKRYNFFSTGLLFALDSEASLSVSIRNTNVQIHPPSVSYFLCFFSYIPTFIHPPLKVTWMTSSYWVKPHRLQINKSGTVTHNTFACKQKGQTHKLLVRCPLYFLAVLRLAACCCPEKITNSTIFLQPFSEEHPF